MHTNVTGSRLHIMKQIITFKMFSVIKDFRDFTLFDSNRVHPKATIMVLPFGYCAIKTC